MAAGQLFASIFVVIFVAELPDKTALASMVLATRHRALPVLLGSSAALAVQSAIAVAAGSLLARLPARPVRVGAGVIFLISAIVMWVRHEDDTAARAEAADAGFTRSLWLSFAMVFLAEWGDLTQIATAGFAARTGRLLLVFAASTTALVAVVVLAVFVGNRAGKLLSARLTQRVAAVLFAAVGVALVTGLL